jgi:hypothetical protein
VDQRAAKRQLLLHAARELAGRPVGKRSKAGRSQQLLDARRALGRRLAEQAAEVIDVLGDREARIEIAPEALRHVGDARHDVVAVRARGDVAAQRPDAAGLQAAHAGDQREQGRFADTIRPDQRGCAAGADGQADIGQGRYLAVAVGDLADLDRERLSW